MADELPDHYDPLLLDVPSAAKVLGIGKTVTYELIGSGQLETVCIGRRRLVPRQALDEYVERLREGAGE